MKSVTTSRLRLLGSKFFTAVVVASALFCVIQVTMIHIQLAPSLLEILRQSVPLDSLQTVEHGLEVMLRTLRIWSLFFVLTCIILLWLSRSVVSLLNENESSNEKPPNDHN